MNEKQWATLLRKEIASCIRSKNVTVDVDIKVPYKFEVLECGEKKPDGKPIAYATDLLIREVLPNGLWKPRVVIELKVNSINSHDAITYSEKAYAHKTVFPYLRYGLVLGNHDKPIPWRLYRHGLNFDFIMVLSSFEPTTKELASLGEVSDLEIEASRELERIIYKQSPLQYTLLHRKACFRGGKPVDIAN